MFDNDIVANGLSHLCNRSAHLKFTECVHVGIIRIAELHHMCTDEMSDRHPRIRHKYDAYVSLAFDFSHLSDRVVRCRKK